MTGAGAEVAWQAAPGAGESVPADAELARAVAAALAHGGRPGRAVAVIVVDEATLTDLHGRFLGDPTPTDVITFDLGEDDAGPGSGGPDGEVYVSLDMARRVAEERGVPLARELCLYVVHGTLHLCGLDDHDPEARAAMREAERAVMAGLGFPADPRPHDHLDRA